MKMPLMADLHSKHPFTPFSEEAKQIIHTPGNVEGVDLCDISPQSQCPYCLKHWMERIVSCDCGTGLVASDATRRLNGERFEVLTLRHFTTKKGGNGGARHGRSEEQRAYYEAKDCFKKARKRGFESILPRFQACEINRSSQLVSDGLEEFCRRSDDLGLIRGYPARTRKIRKGVENMLKQQRTCGTNSGHELTSLQHKPRLGHQFNPTHSTPIFKSDTRQEQQFQQHEDPSIDHGRHRKIRSSYKQCGTICCNGQLILIQAGYGGLLLLPGRRLPRHGGHLQDGNSGECISLLRCLTGQERGSSHGTGWKRRSAPKSEGTEEDEALFQIIIFQERNPWLTPTESCDSDGTEEEEEVKPFRTAPGLPDPLTEEVRIREPMSALLGLLGLLGCQTGVTAKAGSHFALKVINKCGTQSRSRGCHEGASDPRAE